MATRKVRSLLEAGARVMCVSPTFTKSLVRLSRTRWLKCVRGRQFAPFLDRCALAVGASSSSKANQRLSEICARRGILVNVVDHPGLSSFIVPSLFRRGPLQVAISTGGASPLVAKMIRKRLSGIFGEEYGRFLKFMAGERKRLIQKLDRPEKRRKLFRDLVQSRLIRLLKNKKLQEAKILFRRILKKHGVTPTPFKSGDVASVEKGR